MTITFRWRFVFVVILLNLLVIRFMFIVHKNGKGVFNDFTPKNAESLESVASYFDAGGPGRLPGIERFFHYLDHPTHSCKAYIRVGGVLLFSSFLNGDKWMCLDGGLKRNPCLVLSFGVNNEWSFEDGMAALGCKVYAFDPTMGAEDHVRGRNIQFFNKGLYDKKTTLKIGNATCKVDRYENILKSLGLEEERITYLKVDIEGHEVNFLEDVLGGAREGTDPQRLINVNQIGMEIHPMQYSPGADAGAPGSLFARYWEQFARLERLGFRLSRVDINKNPRSQYRLNGQTRSHWYEVVWVNLRA